MISKSSFWFNNLLKQLYVYCYTYEMYSLVNSRKQFYQIFIHLHIVLFLFSLSGSVWHFYIKVSCLTNFIKKKSFLHLFLFFPLWTRGPHGHGPGRHMRGDFSNEPGKQMRDYFSNAPGQAGPWGEIFSNWPGWHMIGNFQNGPDPLKEDVKKRNVFFNGRVWLQKKEDE